MRRALWMASALLALMIGTSAGSGGDSLHDRAAVTVAPGDVDAIAVLASAPTVDDSVTTCAVYQTADGRVGLMTPALVVRRVSPSRVVTDYATNVLERCGTLTAAAGLTVTSGELKQVDGWGMRSRPPRILARGGLSSART